jgi:hypothetical protein
LLSGPEWKVHRSSWIELEFGGLRLTVWCLIRDRRFVLSRSFGCTVSVASMLYVCANVPSC